MASKKSKKPFKFLTARSMGIPANIAVGPLGFQAALDVDPEDGNNPKPSQIIFRETESGAQEPPVPGTSTTVAIGDVEQGDLPTGGTITHIIQEDDSTVEPKVPEQGFRSTMLEVPVIRTDVEEESASGFSSLKSLLEAISIAYTNREESFATKSKVEWLTSCVASLNELFMAPPSYADEKRRRDRLIHELQGIEGQLRSLSQEPGLQCVLDHGQPDEDISRLLEDLREAIFLYQMERRTDIGNQVFDPMDSAESIIINNLCRAKKAEYRHGNRNHCLKGTRISVLDEIELWARDFDRPPVYWLNGLAGMGKSTIAQTIAERMFADGRLGASFFCSRDFEDRRNLQLIFPTIAAQLARRYAKFRSVLVPLVKSDPQIVDETLDGQMNKLIVQPLMRSATSTVIMIDALDECKDDEPASAILSVLGQYAEKIPKVKFFVTGRPEPRIRSGIRLSLLAQATDVFVLHEVKPDQVNSDIRLFYKHNFSGIRSRRHGLDNWPTEEQLDLLCNRAAGLFIYAMATVRFIDQTNKNPTVQLDLLIRSQHSGFEGKAKLREDMTLDSLYMSIFHMAFGDGDPEDDAKVRSVLGAVILATNPLSPSTIAALLGLAPGDVFPILSLLHSLLILSEDIDQPVRPFHKSFSDFIVDPARCANPRFCISPPDQHAELVVDCLKLMDQKLRRNMCKLPDGVTSEELEDWKQSTKQSIDTAFEYACRSWHRHINGTASIRKLTIMPILRRFLEEKFWLWLEVLSILGAITEAVAAFKMIEKGLDAPWILHIYFPPGALPSNPLAASPSSSSTRTKNSSASDQPQLSIPDIVVHIVVPKENEPHHLQESHPPQSPVFASHPGSPLNEAKINCSDEILGQSFTGEHDRARASITLCKLCSSHPNVLRSTKTVNCYDESVTGPIRRNDDEETELFKGSYQGHLVAANVMRSHTDYPGLFTEFYGEMVIWGQLRHSNTIPLLGVTIDSERCSLVSDWMDNGTIDEFIKMSPDANRIDLLIDVVRGLMYMHQLLVAHGDLRGENIFINQDGRACLGGFGRSMIISANAQLNISDPYSWGKTNSRGVRIRWASPERLSHEDPTKESDVYALGMVIYEVLCGTPPFSRPPFSDIGWTELIEMIQNGTHPARPEDASGLGFTDGLWEIVERCWSHDRSARPTLSGVLSCLREAASSWDDRRKEV